MKTSHKILLGLATVLTLLWLFTKMLFSGFILIKTDWGKSRALFWSPFGIHWVSWLGQPHTNVKENDRFAIQIIPPEGGGAGMTPAHVYLMDSKGKQVIYYFDTSAKTFESETFTA